MSTQIPFKKMHGLGNDFVVFDARTHALSFDARAAARISDRRFGIGCDQLIILEEPEFKSADVFMRIRNNDGSEAEACGNATRCIADQLMNETGRDRIVIETLAGELQCWRANNGDVSVDMGPINMEWQDIPLSHEMETLRLDLSIGALHGPAAVNIGNPHCSFFVEDAEGVDLATFGPKVETHAFFPERTNVQVVQVIDKKTIRVRVWERGAGITQASGSSACATAVNAHRRRLTEPKVTVILDGGKLVVERTDDNRVIQTGPYTTSFEGVVDSTLWETAS